jgi:hypothetical protein
MTLPFEYWAIHINFIEYQNIDVSNANSIATLNLVKVGVLANTNGKCRATRTIFVSMLY